MEESFCQGRACEDAATDGASRLAEDGHLRWVAAEVADVPLYPLQGKDLVEQAIVAAMSVFRLLCEFGVSHKTQCSCAVLDAHNDYTSTCEECPEVAAIVLCLESAAVNPNHHGETVAGRCCGSGYTEVQAVFTHHVGGESRTCGLWRPLGKVIGLQHTLPRLCWLWRFPTEVTHGWCSVWNGLVYRQILTVEDALNIACLYMCSQQWLSLRRQCYGEKAEDKYSFHII